jgi:hypothetical protein
MEELIFLPQDKRSMHRILPLPFVCELLHPCFLGSLFLLEEAFKQGFHTQNCDTVSPFHLSLEVMLKHL